MACAVKRRHTARTLERLVKNMNKFGLASPTPDYPAETPITDMEPKESIKETNVQLWSSSDNNTYYAVARTESLLPPDVYDIGYNNGTILFNRVNYSIESLIRFEDSAIDKVVGDIQTFWNREDLFKEYDLLFRRGMLLYGPPGGGKSCTVKLIVHDVIEKGGVAINFTDPHLFIQGMRVFRTIQPETPVVVIMEDIEALLRNSDSSSILNLLDGINGFERIVYLATTNYPEKLEPRIKNRPSRFDRRYKIDNPGQETRKTYLDFLLSKSDKIKGLDIEKWVKDTNGMSFSHIKELFISVNVFGYSYDEALEDLREMSKNITSEDGKKPAGFYKDEAW